MRLCLTALWLATAIPLRAQAAAPEPPKIEAREAEAMDGPYSTVGRFCASCREERLLEKWPAPYKKVFVAVSGDPRARPTPSNQRRHFLVVKTAAGYFFRELGFSGLICGGKSQSNVSLWTSKLDAKDFIPGGKSEILLETNGSVSGEQGQIADRHLFLCGIGKSGKPSCVSLFPYRFTGDVSNSWDLQVTFTPDGLVEKHGWSGTAQNYTERLRISFP